MWVRQPQRADKPYKGEIWFPFGVYRTYWNSPAGAGEFDALLLRADEKEPTEDGWEKQKEVIDAHYFYTKKKAKYGEHMFSGAIIEKGKNKAAHIGPKFPQTPAEQRYVYAATKGCLSRNRGLRFGYKIYVYNGPINDVEIQDAVRAREVRRERERSGEPKSTSTAARTRKSPTATKRKPKAKTAVVRQDPGKPRPGLQARRSADAPEPVQRIKRESLSVSKFNYAEVDDDDDDDDERIAESEGVTDTENDQDDKVGQETASGDSDSSYDHDDKYDDEHGADEKEISDSADDPSTGSSDEDD